MRICQLSRVVPTHAIGGMQDQVMLQSAALVALGHEVVILTTAHPDGRTVEQIDGVEIRYVPRTRPIKFSRSWRRESQRYLVSTRVGRAFDVVHAQGSGGTACLANSVHAALGVPGILSLHGSAADEIRTALNLMKHRPAPGQSVRSILVVAKQMYEHLRFTMPAARKADAVIATSRSAVDDYPRVLRIPKSKVHLIYNSIDTALFQRRVGRRGLLGLGNDSFILLAVARLIEEKGVQYSIRAMPTILVSHPDAQLLVVGDGVYRPKLEQLAVELGIASRVRFVGSVSLSQLPDYYSAADVFLNPTIRRNGYDMTILQSMACGCAVIASDLPSVRSTLDGNTLVMIPPGDAAALSARAIELMEKPDLRASLSLAGERDIRDRFGSESAAKRMVEIYQSVIAGGMSSKAPRLIGKEPC